MTRASSTALRYSSPTSTPTPTASSTSASSRRSAGYHPCICNLCSLCNLCMCMCMHSPRLRRAPGGEDSNCIYVCIPYRLHTRLQPPLHTVAASITYGCSLHLLRLQVMTQLSALSGSTFSEPQMRSMFRQVDLDGSHPDPSTSPNPPNRHPNPNPNPDPDATPPPYTSPHLTLTLIRSTWTALARSISTSS